MKRADAYLQKKRKTRRKTKSSPAQVQGQADGDGKKDATDSNLKQVAVTVGSGDTRYLQRQSTTLTLGLVALVTLFAISLATNIILAILLATSSSDVICPTPPPTPGVCVILTPGLSFASY